MAGLWDQLGTFFDNVGDIASKVADVGETVSSTVATFAGLKSGAAVGTPPLLPSTLPGYGPLYPAPGSQGNQPNTSHLGVQAIQDRIGRKRNEKLALAGLAGLALFLVWK